MNFNTFPQAWDLVYFLEIARTGNLSRAAERLGVSQPTLSVSVKRLEVQLQTQLFYRRNKGLELTESGKSLLKESNSLLNQWETIVKKTQQSKIEAVGNYNFGCHPSVAIYALRKIFKTLYERHSKIQLHLKHGLSRVLCEQVITGTLDFALVINPLPHPDLVIHKIEKDVVGFWKTEKSLTDVLIYNPELIQSDYLLKKSKKIFNFNRTITSDNLEVITRLAESGAGIAILPERVALANSKKIQRIYSTPTFSDELTFLYRTDIEKTKACVEIIKEFKNLTF